MDVAGGSFGVQTNLSLAAFIGFAALMTINGDISAGAGGIDAVIVLGKRAFNSNIARRAGERNAAA